MNERKNQGNADRQSDGKKSNQPISKENSSPNKNKNTTGGLRSKTEGPQFDPSANRERSHDGIKPDAPGQSHQNFSLVVDSVPYVVSATAYRFNDETRYRVSVNGNDEHIFTWDSDLKRLKAIDDEASILPDNLEEAISTKLQSRS
jgi:hypothetical protein